MSLARKSCSYLLLLPDEETLAQSSTVGSTSAADHSMANVRWNTLRSDQMQDSTTAQCSGEMGQRVCAEHQGNPWSPVESVLETSTSVWISLWLEATRVYIRQMLTHQ